MGRVRGKGVQRMTQPRLVMSDMYEAICVEDRFEPALSTDWMARRPTFAVRRTVPCALGLRIRD